MGRFLVFASAFLAGGAVACAARSYRYSGGGGGRYGTASTGSTEAKASYGPSRSFRRYSASADSGSRSGSFRRYQPRSGVQAGSLMPSFGSGSGTSRRVASAPAPSAPGPSTPSGNTGASPPVRTGPATPPRTGTPPAPRGPTGIARRPVTKPGRLIIYNGQLYLRVVSAKEAMAEARKVAEATGAYVHRLAGNAITFRVPVLRFQELMDKLAGLGEVANKYISAQDVTQQFYDAQNRLRALEAVLARLRELLAKAKTVKESLSIEEAMARIVVRVERLKGLLRYLTNHAALSTLTLTLHERSHSRPITQPRTPFTWVRTLGVWRMFRRY